MRSQNNQGVDSMNYTTEWVDGIPKQIIEPAKECDNSCPSVESFDSVFAQNCGCLPCPYDIHQMLLNKEVWMCHSNPKVPCVATGLKVVPEGYIPRVEF